jgi:hypothetical protein
MHDILTRVSRFNTHVTRAVVCRVHATARRISSNVMRIRSRAFTQVRVGCEDFKLTPHISLLTPHSSHLTPHSSHLTPHPVALGDLVRGKKRPPSSQKKCWRRRIDDGPNVPGKDSKEDQSRCDENVAFALAAPCVSAVFRITRKIAREERGRVEVEVEGLHCRQGENKAFSHDCKVTVHFNVSRPSRDKQARNLKSTVTKHYLASAMKVETTSCLKIIFCNYLFLKMWRRFISRLRAFRGGAMAAVRANQISSSSSSSISSNISSSRDGGVGASSVTPALQSSTATPASSSSAAASSAALATAASPLLFNSRRSLRFSNANDSAFDNVMQVNPSQTPHPFRLCS